MKSELLYVELKSGYGDNGPAWIGKAFFSKTGQTVYFNGQILKKGQGISSNYYDLETGDEYWVSGVKKKGTNRHWAGSGKIQIDESVVDEYLELTGLPGLLKTKFEIVELDNVPAKQTATEIENQKVEQEFDDSIRFKNPADLSDQEITELWEYYNDVELAEYPKKSRRSYKEAVANLEAEIEKRKLKKQ